MKKFNDYRISDEILKALDALGYKEPSDVQQRVIPELLQGKDVIVKEVRGNTLYVELKEEA